MSIVGLAALFAAIYAVVGAVLAFFGSKPNFTPALVGGGVAFVVLFFGNWILLHSWQPVFSAGGTWGLIVIEALFAGVVFAVVDAAFKRLGGAPIVAVAMVVVSIIPGLWNHWWMGQGNVNKMLATLQTTVEPIGSYPNTNNNHIVVVPENVAKSIAAGVLNQGNIGTRYNLLDGVLQKRSDHMYYEFPFEADGKRNTSKVHGTAPGYVEVDAEQINVNTRPNFVTQDAAGHPYQIHYWPKGWWDTNLERHIWTYKDASGNRPYQNKYVTDLTFEVDDTGRPYWTASLNTAVWRWRDKLPETFITVDAQTGVITEYKIDGVKISDRKEAARVAALPSVPPWVDRVYSEADATRMIDMFAYYGHRDSKGNLDAPYQAGVDNKNNRFKISSGLNLVYTDDGPAWQAILTSAKAKDNQNTIGQWIVLMDTNKPIARVYPAPAGLKVEDKVMSTFHDAGNNVKKFDITALALHMVDGQMTWVGGMVGNGQADADEASWNGVGLISATSTFGTNVIINTDKGHAFTDYFSQIANGSDNSNPGANKLLKFTSGTVASIQTPVSAGNTTIVIRLVGDTHYYTASFDLSTPTATTRSLAIVSVKEGEKVTIGYVAVDPPSSQITITSLANNSLTTAGK